MKKVFLAIFAVVAITATSMAQKGNNHITPAFQIALPTGDAISIGLG